MNRFVLKYKSEEKSHTKSFRTLNGLLNAYANNKETWEDVKAFEMKEIDLHEQQKSEKDELERRGLEAAALYLERRDYEILDRNWSCYAGEIDFVALDGDELVFADVLTQHDNEQGFPMEVNAPENRERLEKIALAYLTENGVPELKIRFDNIMLIVTGDDKALIRHHINCLGNAA